MGLKYCPRRYPIKPCLPSTFEMTKKSRKQRYLKNAVAFLSVSLFSSQIGFAASDENVKTLWTTAEKQLLLSLSASNLPNVAEDLSNRYQNNEQAALLGAKLFFDTRLSDSGTISCAVCHQPNRDFSDGLRTASGLQKGKRNTPSLLGVSHQKWFFWDGSCLLYTSPSPRDLSTSRMPSSA